MFLFLRVLVCAGVLVASSAHEQTSGDPLTGLTSFEDCVDLLIERADALIDLKHERI